MTSGVAKIGGLGLSWLWQRLDSGSPPQPRRRRKMSGEMHPHDKSVKPFSQKLPASNSSSKNKLQQCTASSRKPHQKTTAEQTETATADSTSGPPSPHHRDVLADPWSQRAPFERDIGPPAFSAPAAKYLCNEADHQSVGLGSVSAPHPDRHQGTDIDTDTVNTRQEHTLGDWTEQISIRPSSAPLSTPLVEDCETLGRAEGSGPMVKGDFGMGEFETWHTRRSSGGGVGGSHPALLERQA